MSIEERYKKGDSVPTIATDFEMEITEVMHHLRRIHVIRALHRTVTERLNQNIQKFLDAYFLDEEPISAFRILFSIDDDTKPLTPAYVYRILDELQVNRRRKNNRLPRFKRQLYDLAVSEYKGGRSIIDILSDVNLVLTEEGLVDELSTRRLITQEVSEEVL